MAKSYFHDGTDWRELVKGEQGEQGPVGPQGPAIDIETGLPISVDTTVGTRVSIGDVDIFYDSGWRDMSDALPDDIDKTRGYFIARRTMHEVHYMTRLWASDLMEGAASTLSILLWDNVHPAFRQTPTSYSALVIGATGGHNQTYFRLSNGSSASHLRVYQDTGEPWTAGQGIIVAGSHLTNAPLPNSLPGTPY